MGERINTAQWLENQKRWQVKVQKDGERRTFTSSDPSRKGQREANAKADAWLDEGIVSTSDRVEKLFDAYVEDLKLTTSKSNWIKVEAAGKNWVKPNVGRLKISILNEQHLQNIINKAAAKGRSKKTLSNIRGILVSFLKYCRKCKATTLFPENITVPKSAKSPRKQILQESDFVTLFSSDTTVMRNKRVFDECIHAYRFQVLTGLRPGELMGLMRNDVQGNCIFVKRSINAYKEITTGKNENAIRKIELNELCLKELNEQLKLSDNIYVFGLESLSTYSKRWRRYCESNGITPVSLYELRHTFVSVAKTLPEGLVKQVVGHSKSMDTFGIYGHEMSNDLHDASARLNTLFSAIINKKE